MVNGIMKHGLVIDFFKGSQIKFWLPLFFLISNFVFSDSIKLEVYNHYFSGDVILKWESKGNFVGYRIYRDEKEFIPEKENLIVEDIKENYYFDHRTKKGKRYFYIVEGIKIDKTSLFSNIVNIVSEKNCVSIEGEFPVLMGWCHGGGNEDMKIHGINIGTSQYSGILQEFNLPIKYNTAYPTKGWSSEDEIKKGKIRPRLFAWSIHDEGWDYKKEKEKIELLRKFDDITPTFSNIMANVLFDKYMLNLTDIISVEHYCAKNSFPRLEFLNINKNIEGENIHGIKRPVWMCFDVFSVSGSYRPEWFTRSSALFSLAYGCKGLYWFNYPPFADGPGVSSTPRRWETVGIINTEMKIWGKYLLKTEFKEEIKNSSKLGAKNIPENEPWFKKVMKVYYKISEENPSPFVVSTILKGNDYAFLFVLPESEIGYYVDKVSVFIPSYIKYKKVFLVSPYFKEEKIFGDKIFCKNIIIGNVYILTDNQNIINEIRENWKKYGEKIEIFYRKIGDLNIEDSLKLIDLWEKTGENKKIEEFKKEVFSLKEKDYPSYEYAFRAGKIFRKIYKEFYNRESPYPEAIKFANEAMIDDYQYKREDSIIKNWKIKVNIGNWGFKYSWESPEIILNPEKTTPDEWIKKYHPKAWYKYPGILDRYPVIKIESEKEENIGIIRIKPYSSEYYPYQIFNLVAIEFVDENRVEFFKIRNEAKFQILKFYPVKTKKINIVILDYPEKVKYEDDLIPLFEESKPFGIELIEAFPPDEECYKIGKSKTGIKRRDIEFDFTRFGW